MTKRQQVVLAALAPGRGAVHTPVQVQKLLFLIDRELSRYLRGPAFNFKAYNYGPFDKAVYEELEGLTQQNMVETVSQGRWDGYRLTANGQAQGDAALDALPGPAKDYIVRASEFVRTLSFAMLVSAIYKAYPDMKENSVFQQ